MRILLVYDNYVRDYRGFLLLQAYLKKYGHYVWIYPGWKNPLKFADLLQIQVMVVGQIAENATEKYGKYCQKKNVLLVINTSEPITAEVNYEMLTKYNTTDSNQDIICLQTVATNSFKLFIDQSTNIRPENKFKYQFLGFPRTDITYHKSLREIEKGNFSKKYTLDKYKKIYIFISSFLFDETFDGIPQKDLDSWNYESFKTKNDELREHTVNILDNFLENKIHSDDILLIKKHPWDCTDFWLNFSRGKNCKVLDNIEFITTCVDACDVVIHTYSTSAVEAWIAGKPTISIFLEKYSKNNLIHMEFDNITYNYESFVSKLGELKIPNINNEILFNGLSDGMATKRLAEEINKLIPKRKVFVYLNPKRNIKVLMILISKYLLEIGLLKYNLSSIHNKQSKIYDFKSWENNKYIVNKKYKRVFKKFVDKY